MALRTPSPTCGTPDQFLVDWESFVQLALEITVEAYQRMCRDGVAQQDWEEDTFTLILTEDYIQELAHKNPLNLIAMPQTRAHTPAMKTEAVSPKRAAEIDIRLFDPWQNHARVYFAWECKRVGDRKANTRYGALISEYITNGILRFLDEKYASGLDDAGMLGYVLAGDVADIVFQINTSMQHPRRARPLSSKDHLEPTPAIGAFTDSYRSRHKRTASQRPIRLHHLFLTFDFEQ